MLQIKKLYTEPTTIDPIQFQPGLNFIFGEKSDSSSKNNGVGKSLCIEFINFALLKKASHSRVLRIPKEVFSYETSVCLDFTLNNSSYTIKRLLSAPEKPTIIVNGDVIVFSKLEDATIFLTEKLFENESMGYPSFRQMLGLLIRDESSEFKSLVACFDTNLKVPDDYSSHLYLLGIDVELYLSAISYFNESSSISEQLNKIKENVKLIRQKDIKDARADLNELDSEVTNIQLSIEQLENMAGYDTIKNDMLILEDKIDKLRRQRDIAKHTLSKIKPISEAFQIDSSEIREFYEQLKNGLGELIAKDLNEVMDFKHKIEKFQNHLLNERKSMVLEELFSVNENISVLDKKYKENLKILDRSGSLRNLKQTYAAYQSKSDELAQLRSFLDRHEELEIKKQQLKTEKENKLLEIQANISSVRDTISSLEKTILEIHEYIQGNRKASFEVKHLNKKQVIEIDMRIDSDGSHSVDREKVFIYDFSLFTNATISRRHPGFLIHDGIFEVDQDTLIRSLIFIVEKSTLSENKQYILTLNSDRIETSQSDSWYQLLNEKVRARFTKENRFLKRIYQQT